MDRSYHFDVNVLIGIIKYAVVRAKESSEQEDRSDPSPSLGLGLVDLMVATGKEFARLAASIGGSVVGGLLPDALEPPLTPNHRSLMHSWIANTIAMTIAIRSNSERKSPERRLAAKLISDFLTSIPVGYVSHLLCDATTARGLPGVL